VKLVSLEIKGFKSFAEKTVINFNNQVTGIVGPNGCGKSNVVDAIRWVIGEQKSSSLRSEKMEELIFNGTKQRKASSLAEVSLTFENDRMLLPTEYNTITISRHYYRNGESEYRLNGVTCRLKDITGLFLDTGISSDSYAIIELKMIDEILNDKENSRRKLFEQAAGISKYKQRKRETMNKLELTQTDLNRVDDLLFEIEGNLKTLESQAKKTERYYKIKEEYKVLSIELALFTIHEIQISFEELNKQKEDQENARVKLEAEIATHESRLQKEKSDNIEKEKLFQSVQREANDHVNTVKQKENEKKLLTENQKFQLDKKTGAINGNRLNNDRLQKISIDIEQLHLQKTKEQERLQILQNEFNDSALKRQSLRDMHAQNKNSLEKEMIALRALEKEHAEHEKNLSIHVVQKENLKMESERIESEELIRNSENENLKNELNKFLVEEESFKKQIAELTFANDELESHINSLTEEIERAKEKLNEVNRKLDARQNEFNLTQSFIQNMEGFPESIKFLRSNKSWSKNAPLLSDVISSDPKYRVAIETYLEPYLSYYVVEDLKEATQAVNLLSSAAKGRANFFIVNDFTDFINSKTDSKEALQNAASAISTEKKYRSLANYLLGQVFIVENDSAVDWNEIEKGTTVITADGKLIRQPHAVSGGQVGALTGKRLGRMKNLEDLKSDIEKFQKETQELRDNLHERQKQLMDLRGQSGNNALNDLREEYAQVRNQIAAVRTKLENIEVNRLRSAERKNQIAQQHQSMDIDHEGTKKLLLSIDKRKLQQQQKADEWQKQFNESETHLHSVNEDYNQKNIGFLQQQNKLSGIAQELNFKIQQQGETQQFIADNEQVIKIADEEMLSLAQQLAVLEAELIHLYQQKNILDIRVNAVEQEYFAHRGAINELEEKIRVLQKNKEQTEHLLASIHEKTAELKFKLNSLKDRLDIEFKTDIETLLDKNPDAEQNVEELTAKVARIKNRIDTFGEVNPMAMEAYNEMNQRYDFIQSQKSDLIKAKQDLMQTIEEIDTTAKKQFMETFDSVRENFVGVFRSLFTNEDDCDLILLTPDDVLESKIEIIAKPKGKRPLSINQLSGGEKTLTAISLLFALYLHKPAPFCILDEVDAPLDDANVGKFSEIIRDFARNSQFVLVTHNKQTMSNVDVIYGVTMQEQGVSKMVPVDFRSLN
jgi:chromosome segregation protein